ncbi:MAG: AAA family ATPase [Oscillospiraceae bacterium]
MAKRITRIVLTGGPAAGKTTLISRILKEFKQDDGWKVITIPETATELISGFGIRPFGNCVSMLDFQYFVIADQLHKEKLALKGAQMVPEENVLIIYDRALFDDKAYSRTSSSGRFWRTSAKPSRRCLRATTRFCIWFRAPRARSLPITSETRRAMSRWRPRGRRTI